MAKEQIQLISPGRVYAIFVLGLFLLVGGYIWPARAKDEKELATLAMVVGAVMIAGVLLGVRNPFLVIRYHHNPKSVVGDLIRSWRPEPAKLESAYEKSLHQFLKSKLPFVKVTRQYGTARVKCDLATGSDVMIELKAGFKSTQKLQRLIGQVDLFRREWHKPLFVVLLGETEEDLLHDLHRTLADYREVYVITKDVEGSVADDKE